MGEIVGKLSTPPLISFETGRRTQTQSSGQPQELHQQMEAWFSIVRNRGREANTRAEVFFARFS